MPQVRTWPIERVAATPAATALIEQLQQKYGALLFHQSGGCCDGSAPMCFAQTEFMLGDVDVWLGDIAGAPFYMSASQFEYWQNTYLTVDVVSGRGASFSLEAPLGVRFLIRSRMFSDDELALLAQ